MTCLEAIIDIIIIIITAICHPSSINSQQEPTNIMSNVTVVNTGLLFTLDHALPTVNSYHYFGVGKLKKNVIAIAI